MNTVTGFQTVLEHFQRNHWTFQAEEARLAVRSCFRLSHGTTQCIVVVDGSDEMLQVLCCLPFVVSPERKADLSELCVRLSAGLRLGRFDLNYETGELRFCACTFYPQRQLKEDLVGRLLGVSLAVVERYFHAFTATLYASALPAVAALECGGRSAKIPGPPPLPTPGPHPRFNLN